MKTIQIPSNNNPFIVSINNNVYQYRAGETVEVPDEVAAAIEDALEMKPKPGRYLSKFAQFIEGTITDISAKDLEGVKTISSYAFHQRNLRSIEIPEGVSVIGSYSMAFCMNITEIEIPSSVTTINYRAFSGCSNLNKVTFAGGSLIKVMAENAFADCTNLSRVTINAKKPPSIQSNTFANVPSTCVFEVPADALAAYKSAANWSALANQIVAIKE